MPTGIYTRTKEHNKKISEGLLLKNKINPNPGNFKKGHNPWHKGTKGAFSKEYIEKLSNAKKGKKMHPNTVKALSKSLIGNTHTLGKKMPETMVNKLRIRMTGNQINKGRHHTDEYKEKMSNINKGEKNHNWKGGITPINQKIRQSRIYKEWEKMVFERDNYTCQKCEDKKEPKTAHHILNFSTYINLRFDIDNGITFCRRCHKWFHQLYGRKNNTDKQLKEFIKTKHERKRTDTNKNKNFIDSTRS